MPEVLEPQPLGRTGARPPLVGELVSRILGHIRANGLGPGQRLPTTAELAKAYGVAPTTVREAVRRLEATGVLVVRHGVGTFVAAEASRLLLINPDRIEPDLPGLAQLIDARQLIEPTLAGRAALRRTDADLADMRALLATSGELRDDRPHAGPVNLRFHTRIAQAAGNVLLSDMLSVILELHTDDQLVIDRLFDDPDRDHAEHLALLDAIERRDAARASALMTEHLAEVLTSVRRADGDA